MRISVFGFDLEHCSTSVFEFLFQTGFGIEKVDKYFNGQFLGIEVYPLSDLS